MNSASGFAGSLMTGLTRLSSARTRSISPENFTGEKGKGAMATQGTGAYPARELGQGWKVSPSVGIPAGSTFQLADIGGPGAIQQIWMTPTGQWRLLILRIYWDDQTQPSVECPLGDFFASGWGRYAQLSSLAVCVNPGSAFNSYWEMPFRNRCRMTLTNLSEKDITLYFQISYTLEDIASDRAYFHAQFRRSNPLPFKSVHTLLDGVTGQGHYAGTYLAWSPRNNGWWGEGEVKFYLDGDTEFPTIAGTGTEDYFGGSYSFEHQGRYEPYTTPYSGLHQVIRPDGMYQSQMRLGMYRWHIADPIRFQSDLGVTIQALGWHEGRYLLLQDDIASVAYWYQTLPTAPFPVLPDKDALNVI
jgi:hypothetical protein